MIQYLEQCQSAKESGLLKGLDPFPHFKDTAREFSLADMEKIRESKLLPDLRDIHKSFSEHIRQTCQVRRGAGLNHFRPRPTYKY